MIHPDLTYMFFVSGIMDDVDQAFYPEDFTAVYLHLHIIYISFTYHFPNG